jgi:hypothetical protein
MPGQRKHDGWDGFFALVGPVYARSQALAINRMRDGRNRRSSATAFSGPVVQGSGIRPNPGNCIAIRAGS